MDDIYDSGNWVQLAENKPGVKILARIPSGNNDTGIAYFKYPSSPDVGPIAANEFIASKLAEKLGLPINKTLFKEFEGVKGVLVNNTPGEANIWRQYPFKKDIERTLHNAERLSRVVVFDVFILNTDRSPDNFVYTRLNKGKYEFYLIDHAHSLHGPSQQALDYNAFNFSSMVQIEEFKNFFEKGFDHFRPHIEDIQNIEDPEIVDIVNSVPSDYLTDAQKNTVKDLLINRKGMLYNKFETFCSSPTW